MDDLDLLIDLHLRNDRQGPGSDADTIRALELARIDPGTPLRVADLGCGCGASALCLARALGDRLAAPITAIDMLPAFVERVRERAVDAGLADRIDARAGDMGAPPLEANTLDLIWSEAAIYNIGFAEGVRTWKPLLRPGGTLVVSELTWTTANRPGEIEAHWTAEYPGITAPSANMRTLEDAGYAPIGFFFIPASSWLAHYYAPLEAGADAFLERHDHRDAARAIVESDRAEADLYRTHGRWFGYAYYIAQQPEHP